MSTESSSPVAVVTCWKALCCGFILRTDDSNTDVIGDTEIEGRTDKPHLGYIDGDCPGCGKARQTVKKLN